MTVLFSRFKAAAIALATSISMLAAVPVYAKGSSYVAATSSESTTAMMPKEAAVGFMYTRRWTIGTAGQILICPRDAEYEENQNTCLVGRANWWQSPERIAAAYGRTYTGFQVVRHYHSVELIVFWK